MPFGSGGSDSSSAKAHLPHVSTLSRPGTRPAIRPVIRDSQRRASHRRPAFLPPFGCRHSLLGHPVPARELGPPCGRLTGPPEDAPDPDGVSVFHTHEKRLGLGVLCTPETTVSTRSSDVLDRRLPLCNGMSLSPRYYHPSRRVTITRHQQGFTVIHPMPSLPFACDSQTERESLGFPLSFTPDRARPGRACQGRDEPWTLARITSSTSADLLRRTHS